MFCIRDVLKVCFSCDPLMLLRRKRDVYFLYFDLESSSVFNEQLGEKPIMSGGHCSVVQFCGGV